jgi:cytoskeleton protein RodZ
MADFGDKLREARQRRGISLRQIADRTKISIAALESLERSDPSRLPGGIFTRSFVRSYASEVGLDPDVTLREFVTRFDIDPPVVPVVVPPDVPPSERAFEQQQRMASMVVKIIVASLVAVAIVLYLMRARHPDDQSTAPRSDPGKRTSRRAASRATGVLPPQA